MAKTYVQKGNTLTLTAPAGGVLSGQGFMSGALFGVAQFDAEAGAPVEAAVTGVWILPKPNSVVTFAEGARVFWDSAGKTCKATGTGYFCIGAATVAAAATDASVVVRLDGNSLVAA